MIIFLLILASCGGTKYNCVKLKSINKIAEDILIQQSDSVAEIMNLAWKEKEEAKKEGLMIDVDFYNEVYFNQNCNSTSDLESIYYLIGGMIKDKKVKIRIFGNSDSVENEINPDLSLERAEFMRDVFIKNGIQKNRIELIDAKVDRPYGPITKNGNKVNRRVDFEFIVE
ncbi:hypothetical protein KZY98_14300 [Croceibacter atlanticus]|uniref:OmpA family protein n=1 Tax=Croceibacter atlanticus TaxID=313588 RepID=UPI001C5E5EDA|nr:hypothetical protein [Croceibacter atlanticus]MBW4971628.1 hypothetical protein [Croceibacter atlanticus]